MKNIIYYYYNLVPEDIHQTKERYYFKQNNNHYSLVLYEGDFSILNDIYILHNSLINKGIYIHQIIPNKDQNIISLIDGRPYILLKTLSENTKIKYESILPFTNSLVDNNLNFYNSRNNYHMYRNNIKPKKNTWSSINWADLWSAKTDYLEYQISQIGLKHSEIKDSFSYYIGLSETSIQLASTVQTNIPKTISHKRINHDDTYFELYNPLNIIIDSRVRDAAEYFKDSFFNNYNINNEINHFITNTNLSKEEHILFLARMIYPTYYFDLYEEIIRGNLKDEEIKNITKLSNDYENLLKNLYKYYKNRYKIQPIEWLDRY